MFAVKRCTCPPVTRNKKKVKVNNILRKRRLRKAL
jgi:hypothetical protein